jgi:hypothetical protein
MKKQEFEQALRAIYDGETAGTNAEARVLVAIGFVLRKRLAIGDEWWQPDQQQVRAFIEGITVRQAGMLRQIANGLHEQARGTVQ